MRTIDVSTSGHVYPAHVGSGLLARQELWNPLIAERPAFVVSNDIVAGHYLSQLKAGLGRDDLETFILPEGEQSKTIANWTVLLDYLARAGASRDSCLIALGGGVVGDLCGFAAATYMRGIDYVQVPTTLLAQVDASVGGKTGVNLPHGKNLVGAFHQPITVVVDVDTLSTLPPREFRAGLAEVVKYGAICDAGFFDFLETASGQMSADNSGLMIELVQRSLKHKAEVVAADEKESGIRALLNFGHSFAHAIETLTDYRQFLHGEAVAIGMRAAAILSEDRSLCPGGIATRIEKILLALHLPTTIPEQIGTREMLQIMTRDKKNTARSQRLILLASLGHAVIDAESTHGEIGAAIDACRNSSPELAP